ncbi:MAG: disulfide bond formation protein B [Alphaproteobacteria bacterium]
MERAARERSARRMVAAAILASCLAVLGAALVFQYGFGLEPCPLCLMERVPWAVAAVLAGAVLVPRVGPIAGRYLVSLCALAFLVNAGIAFYHVGVEGHWWVSAVCSASSATADIGFATLADLERALERPAEVPCDRVQWTLFGLSLTGYNLLASLVLAVASGGAALRTTWWRTTDAR